MVEVVDPSELKLSSDFDNRYADAEGRFGVRRNAVQTIPVIDVSPFVGGGSARERAAIATEVRQACIDIGFFQIVGHGIAKSELAAALDWGKQFFHLPLTEKMRVHASKSATRRGFIGAGGVDPSANPDKTPDIKERFMMSREAMTGEAAADSFTVGASQWPEMLPGFESFMKAHMRARVKLSQDLMRCFALSLQLSETFFDDVYARPGGTLALNYYPPVQPEILAKAQWSFSPHTDYGGLTLLTQDDAGGLQARNCAGEWIDVPPVDGAFVINIGDMFAMWTNDLYSSNLHRAMNTGGQERLSIAFFTSPNPDTLVQCLPTCQSAANPPRYSPIKAGDYNNVMISQSHKTGRPGVSRDTANRLKAESSDVLTSRRRFAQITGVDC